MTYRSDLLWTGIQAGKDKLHDDYKKFCFHLEKHHGTSPVQVVSSGPNSETEHLKNMYIKMILSAKESVCIQTPYFIPDTSFMDACKMALLSSRHTNHDSLQARSSIRVLGHMGIRRRPVRIWSENIAL